MRASSGRDPVQLDMAGPVITLSRTSAKGRKQRFKLRHYRKAPAKAIAAAPKRPASGNQCERIERKAARRKCSKAPTILDIIRKNAVHASLKAVDASRECPAQRCAFAIAPGSVALCWILQRL